MLTITLCTDCESVARTTAQIVGNSFSAGHIHRICLLCRTHKCRTFARQIQNACDRNEQIALTNKVLEGSR